jgi:hypothetical protein
LEITVNSATALALSGPVQNPGGHSLTLSGGGTLTITQGLSTTGLVDVQAGTLIAPSIIADTLVIGQAAASAAVAVPEPSTCLLLIASLVGVCIAKLRKKLSLP